MGRQRFSGLMPVLVLLLASTLVSICPASAESSAAVSRGSIPQKSLEECEALGYEREVVRCAHCDLLLAHTGNTELQQECLSCCTAANDGDEKEVVYVKAKIVAPHLERMLKAPSSLLSKFVKKYENEPYFTKVTLEDAGWAHVYPELVLLSADDEELRIQLFDIQPHKIHELLQKKLQV